MRYRLFGNTGLRVSDLFLGTMNLAERSGSGETPAEFREMLDRYADAGGNVIDTASAYGDSEHILGELLENRRERFVLGTKYAISRDSADPNAAGNHRKNLTATLERSLRRLRTDHVDVLWVHFWDRHTPLEEMMRALDDAVRSGKVLYLGISDAPAWVVSRANALAEAHGWTPFAGVQAPYNPLNRDVERELLPMAEYLGLSIAAWGPLASGVLSAKVAGQGGADASTRFSPHDLTERDHRAATTAREIADELGATPSQVALAWLRARSPAVHPILGPRNMSQLEDNLGAASLTLPEDAVRRLSAAVEFTPGFPNDFLAECEANPWVVGRSATDLDGRTVPGYAR